MNLNYPTHKIQNSKLSKIFNMHGINHNFFIIDDFPQRQVGIFLDYAN